MCNDLMTSLRDTIQAAAAAGLQAHYNLSLPASDIAVQRTAPDHVGDFTVVLFPLLKLKLGSPDQIGQTIGTYLREQLPAVADFAIVKGFLNLTISDAYWTGFLTELVSQPDAVLRPRAFAGQKVMVEFSSPNTNKPLHLGHLRNNFLGDSVCRILDAVGYEVTRANLVNDRGVHICKSMLAWQQSGGGTPEAEDLKGDHLVGKYYVRFDQMRKAQIAERIATGLDPEAAEKDLPIDREVQQMLQQWEAGDPAVRALWEKLNGWVYQGFDATYARMGIHFDKIYRESETYLLGKDVVDEGLAKGVFYQKPDGSVWIDLTDIGLDHKLVLRGDGTSVYITQDLGTADLKYRDYAMQRSVYVIGNEQDYHMKVLIAILQRLGRPYAEGMYHLSYGMVELPSGKMKSREGTVVDADDLMQAVVEEAARETSERGKVEGLSPTEVTALHEMLGIGAIKYYLLKVSPVKKMMFDPNESVSLQGDTGPFIQYTHARIRSLLARAAQQGFAAQTSADAALHPTERDIIARLYQYPQVALEAAASYNPSVVAQYVVELAKDYNRFYYEVPVLKETDPAALGLRLALSEATANAIRHCMGLLGIGVPDRM